MIVEYSRGYNEDIKDLFLELQTHIAELDKEKYNIVTSEYREKYFEKTMQEIEKYQGKMFLYVEGGNVLGLIVGMVYNDATTSYDFKAPKRGKITELIVSKSARGRGVGKKLLQKEEGYLKQLGCSAILLDVFAYNEGAIEFYKKHGYNARLIEMIKTNI